MRWLADCAYVLAAIAYLPVALYHAVFRGKNRHGWGERFGCVPDFAHRPLAGAGRNGESPGTGNGTQRRIWIHAVSLGEINATPRLVEELQSRIPDAQIVFSTTTDTGFARAVSLYGRERVFRFPLDFSLVVARALRRIQPDMIVLVELEVWFNLVRMAARAGIPVAVVNGRLTERSFRRLRRLGGFSRAAFRDLAWVGAQDETIASRFRALGVSPDRIEVTSSLKWDTAQVIDRVDGSESFAAALGLVPGDRTWVCGSTGPGEEPIILEAYRALLTRRQAQTDADTDPPFLRLALVPRKPERFDEVARLVESAGFVCVRRSACLNGNQPKHLPASAVILGDTMGELRKFYSIATIVFVGRSLVPMGGSDPMEVAALGRPMIAGPHMDNFAMPVQALAESDAIRLVDSAKSLAATVETLLESSDKLAAMGERARSIVLRNQGATQRTAERLSMLISPGRDQPIGSVSDARATVGSPAGPII